MPFDSPRIRAREMSMQFLKTRLDVLHIVEYFTNNSMPARPFARFVCVKVAGAICFFLTVESGAEPNADDGLVELAAQTASHCCIDGGCRRFGMEECADSVEKDNSRKRMHKIHKGYKNSHEEGSCSRSRSSRRCSWRT